MEHVYELMSLDFLNNNHHLAYINYLYSLKGKFDDLFDFK